MPKTADQNARPPVASPQAPAPVLSLQTLLPREELSKLKSIADHDIEHRTPPSFTMIDNAITIGHESEMRGQFRLALQYKMYALLLQQQLCENEGVIGYDINTARCNYEVAKTLGGMYASPMDALSFHEKALDARESLHASGDHADLATSRNSVGFLRLKMMLNANRFLPYFYSPTDHRSIFDIKQKKKHQEEIDAHLSKLQPQARSLAAAAASGGQASQTEKSIEEQDSAEENCIRVAKIRNLMQTGGSDEQIKEALGLMKKSLKTQKKLHFPKDHEDIVTSLACLGDAQCALGQSDAGIKNLQACVDMLKRMAGSRRTSRLAFALCNLGVAQYHQGQFTEASKSLENGCNMLFSLHIIHSSNTIDIITIKSLPYFSKFTVNSHQGEIAQACINLGLCYLALGKEKSFVKPFFDMALKIHHKLPEQLHFTEGKWNSSVNALDLFSHSLVNLLCATSVALRSTHHNPYASAPLKEARELLFTKTFALSDFNEQNIQTLLKILQNNRDTQTGLALYKKMIRAKKVKNSHASLRLESNEIDLLKKMLSEQNVSTILLENKNLVDSLCAAGVALRSTHHDDPYANALLEEARGLFFAKKFPGNKNEEKFKALTNAKPSEFVRPFAWHADPSLRKFEYPNTKNKVLETLFLLGPHTEVLRKIDPPNEIFVRYKVPKERKDKVEKLIEHTQLASRHPNVLMSLLAVKHRDGSVDVDVEYADAGPLMVFLSKFDPDHRTHTALSITRQILEAFHYFHVVHGKHHRNLNPRTVLLRRDGCMKLDVFDNIDEETCKLNPAIFLTTPYCAPENRDETGDATKLLAAGEKHDVWSLGVLIVAIMLGKPLRPRNKPDRQDIPSRFRVTPQDEINFKSEKETLKNLIASTSDDEWKAVIPDDGLRYLARRCLQAIPENRPTLAEALAITHLIGHLRPNLNNPWQTDPSGLEKTNKVPTKGPELQKEIAAEVHNLLALQCDSLENLTKSPVFKQATESVATLLTDEMGIWRKERSISTKRSGVDKFMREIVKKRTIPAWKSFAKCVEVARARNKAEIERTRIAKMGPSAATAAAGGGGTASASNSVPHVVDPSYSPWVFNVAQNTLDKDESIQNNPQMPQNLTGAMANRSTAAAAAGGGNTPDNNNTSHADLYSPGMFSARQSNLNKEKPEECEPTCKK